MISNKQNYKCERTKCKIISGSGHQTHCSNKYIEPSKQLIDISCNCEVKCASLFTNKQKLQVFKQYNSLKTHE